MSPTRHDTAPHEYAEMLHGSRRYKIVCSLSSGTSNTSRNTAKYRLPRIRFTFWDGIGRDISPWTGITRILQNVMSSNSEPPLEPVWTPALVLPIMVLRDAKVMGFLILTISLPWNLPSRVGYSSMLLLRTPLRSWSAPSLTNISKKHLPTTSSPTSLRAAALAKEIRKGKVVNVIKLLDHRCTVLHGDMMKGYHEGMA
eukprot:CAMPEP_0198113336 /NCGR_PEP_ID=MMETSP1442-20131203/5034_1 /TAXON_ID= /ORGANISM="Craspedostauros australis, Strain CCMP3328" /LENGTH=198 /DNA_ID=CAMNT_0043770399 /DNA_START=241 /DNA_END=837 /DNA_ORIENTATION=-